MEKRSRSYGGVRYAFFLIALMLLPGTALGGEATVINNISASASTGGQTASGSEGEVSEGESSSRVRVLTEVNGEVVTDIDEVAEDGEISIEEEVRREDEGVDVRTSARAEAGSSEVVPPANSSAGVEMTTEVEAGEETTGETGDQAAAEEAEGVTFAAGGSASLATLVRTWVNNVIAYVFGFFK